MNQIRARRHAALQAIQRFRELNALPVSEIKAERRRGEGIMLIASTSDGREYGIGYSVAR